MEKNMRNKKYRFSKLILIVGFIGLFQPLYASLSQKELYENSSIITVVPVVYDIDLTYIPAFGDEPSDKRIELWESYTNYYLELSSVITQLMTELNRDIKRKSNFDPVCFEDIGLTEPVHTNLPPEVLIENVSKYQTGNFLFVFYNRQFIKKNQVKGFEETISADFYLVSEGEIINEFKSGETIYCEVIQLETLSDKKSELRWKTAEELTGLFETVQDETVTKMKAVLRSLEYFDHLRWLVSLRLPVHFNTFNQFNTLRDSAFEYYADSLSELDQYYARYNSYFIGYDYEIRLLFALNHSWYTGIAAKICDDNRVMSLSSTEDFYSMTGQRYFIDFNAEHTLFAASLGYRFTPGFFALVLDIGGGVSDLSFSSPDLSIQPFGAKCIVGNVEVSVMTLFPKGLSKLFLLFPEITFQIGYTFGLTPYKRDLGSDDYLNFDNVNGFYFSDQTEKSIYYSNLYVGFVAGLSFGM